MSKPPSVPATIESEIKPKDNKISVKLLTDKPDENPLLRFNEYRDVLFDLIVKSDPRFSIGIYGEWGTGKTTLMKILEDKLKKEEDILVIWFNAWKYERDKNLIVISLLKSIIFGMHDHPRFKKLQRTILGTIVDLDKGITDRFGLNEKSEDIFLKEKNSIYFEGIEKIENDLVELRSRNEKCRIVVFIDDLDRCSPERAVEIFESIKGFLDIAGLVYVIGLSYETIGKFVTAKYKDIGISGENYIRKIIQIPILIPEWNNNDIEILTGKLSSEVGNKYSKLISDNKELISYGIRLNPRELKIFMNSFVMAGEIFFDDQGIITKDSPNSKKYVELLIVLMLTSRWQSFSRIFTHYKIDNKIINELVSEEDARRQARLNYYKGMIDNESFEVLSNHIQNIELWKFLKKSKDILLSIDDWNKYLRPTDINIGFHTLLKRFAVNAISKQELVKDILMSTLGLAVGAGASVSKETIQEIQDIAENRKAPTDTTTK